MSNQEGFSTEFLKSRNAHHNTIFKIDDIHEFGEFIRRALTNLDYSIHQHDVHVAKHPDARHALANASHNAFMVRTRAKRKIMQGTKFSRVWKLCALLALGTFGFYLFFSSPSQYASLQTLFGIFTISALVLFLIKETASITVWVKALGVFDPTKKEGLCLALVSGHPTKEDNTTTYHLDENMAEICHALNANFIRPKKMSHLLKKDAQKIISEKLAESTKELSRVNTALANGELLADEGESQKQHALERKKSLEISQELLLL
ncbi:hypothetical protein COT72_01725 [archaeon CG10_big_fil_rev_8_21_14_0_10_43_11]|nr:MAG: hypothetical protein COT72_01725 [archaeon CG10_big_fil_rev_8_21_14_0_10_43_11]